MILSELDVRALTIRQPWAALIACGVKPVENRSWPLPASFSGPLLIHAGMRDDADGWRALRAEPRSTDRTTAQVDYGAIIAVAMNVTCHRDTGCCRDRWGEPGVWHWVLDDVRRLPEPISATGRLKLWTPEPEAASAALAVPQSTG
ncbi:ASCH domain-containing protein [Streptomyces canus]|uniref:ASCH domain-containing protein n=1 Tax=Streptomyces canus TaxID=58343 RepID=UPI00037B56AC|nr:ASCH domain-containing protein [Streptomyces canus]